MPRAYVAQTSSDLSSYQLHQYAEQLFSMEFVRYGLSVFSPEADNRGIDLVVRNESGDHYDVKVRASRDHRYVFLTQSDFPLLPQMYAALALFFDRQEPELYLIPSIVWRKPNDLFVDKDYEGWKREPEWGIRLSQENRPRLRPYAISTVLKDLQA